MNTAISLARMIAKCGYRDSHLNSNVIIAVMYVVFIIIYTAVAIVVTHYLTHVDHLTMLLTLNTWASSPLHQNLCRLLYFIIRKMRGDKQSINQRAGVLKMMCQPINNMVTTGLIIRFSLRF